MTSASSSASFLVVAALAAGAASVPVANGAESAFEHRSRQLQSERKNILGINIYTTEQLLLLLQAATGGRAGVCLYMCVCVYRFLLHIYIYLPPVCTSLRLFVVRLSAAEGVMVAGVPLVLACGGWFVGKCVGVVWFGSVDWVLDGGCMHVCT